MPFVRILSGNYFLIELLLHDFCKLSPMSQKHKFFGMKMVLVIIQQFFSGRMNGRKGENDIHKLKKGCENYAVDGFLWKTIEI